MKYFFLLIFFLTQSVYGQEKHLNKNIFGFATSNTFTYCSIYDTSFVKKVKRINPQVLRFPGGAVGNFYHFGKKWSLGTIQFGDVLNCWIWGKIHENRHIKNKNNVKYF